MTFPASPEVNSPRPELSPDTIARLGPDMTLRDYFAGQALVTLEYAPYDQTKDAASNAVLVMATRAYRIADAMLEARSK